MDKKTKEFLSRLGQSIPREMLNKAAPKERTHNSEGAMERFAHTKSDAERKEIMKNLNEGKFAGKERFSSSPRGGEELNKWFETKIEKAIESGRIEKPKDDSFTKMVKEKMK